MIVKLNAEQQEWLNIVCDILTDFEASESGCSYTATVTADQLKQLLEMDLINPDGCMDWGTVPTNEQVDGFLGCWGDLFTAQAYFEPSKDDRFYTFYFTGIETKADISAAELWGDKALEKANQCWIDLTYLILRLDSAEFEAETEKGEAFPQVSVSFF
jgi:hypothetical protein